MNLKGIGQYFEKNGPSVLTLVSVVLTGFSVYFAIKKAEDGQLAKYSYEAGKEILDEKPLVDRTPNDELALKVSYTKDIIKTYKESLICATGAITCAILSNKLNGKKIAGLAAAVALNEDKIRKLYSAAEKRFGPEAKEKLTEQMASDSCPFDDPEEGRHRYKKEPVEVFYETFYGTAFESTGKDVNAAIAKAKRRYENERRKLNFNKWRSLLGLEDIPAGTYSEFNPTHPFDPYTKIIIVNGEEMIGIFYRHDPCVI